MTTSLAGSKATHHPLCEGHFNCKVCNTKDTCASYVDGTGSSEYLVVVCLKCGKVSRGLSGAKLAEVK